MQSVSATAFGTGYLDWQRVPVFEKPVFCRIDRALLRALMSSVSRRHGNYTGCHESIR